MLYKFDFVGKYTNSVFKIIWEKIFVSKNKIFTQEKL